MLPDRVSNPGPLTYESGALPIALRGPAFYLAKVIEPRRKDSLHCHLWKIIGCFFKYFKLCN